MAEFLRFKPGKGPCDVHSWTKDDFRNKLVPTMRERYRKGGVNICRACVEKIRVLRAELAQEMPS